MIINCFALALFSKICMTLSSDLVQPDPLILALAGENVTLRCFFSKDETGYISWYKQPVGEKIHLIATSHKYSLDATFHKNFNNKRFRLKLDAGQNNLIIAQTEPADSGFYYCGVMRDYATIFGAGTLLTIKGEPQKSESWTVVQRPVSESVPPGDSVTLQCTVDSGICAGEHSVYWFRHGSGESLPGLIYTHGNRSDEAGSPTQSCVYSLPKRNLSRSDAGTYYCAVATCGEVLFGNGTKVDIEDAVFPVIPALGVPLFLCVVIIVLLLCIRNKKYCGYCTEQPARVSQQLHRDGFTAEETSNQNHETELPNYAALHFPAKNQKNVRKKRELKEDSVYSQVKCTE